MNIGFTLIQNFAGDSVDIVSLKIDPNSNFLDRTCFTQIRAILDNGGRSNLREAASLVGRTSIARIVADGDPLLSSPVDGAASLAKLDLNSDGRLAVRFDTTAVQQSANYSHLEAMKRLDEYLVLLKRLLANDRAISHEGRWYRIDDGYVVQKGVQGRALPIWLNGTSGSALQLAGRHADVFELAPAPLQDVSDQVDRVRAAAQQFGRGNKIRFVLPLRVAGYDGPTRIEYDLDSIVLSGEPKRVVRSLFPYIRLGVSEFAISGLTTNSEIADFSWRVAPLLRDIAGEGEIGAYDLPAIAAVRRMTGRLN